MNLYGAISNYQLLNAILLRVKDSTSKGTLVLSQWNKEKLNEFENLKRYFDEVKIIDANYRFQHTFEEATSYLQDSIGRFSQYEKIYVWGAQFSLGVCLAEGKIPFIYGEEGAGLMSRPEILERNERQDVLKYDFYCDYIKQLGLYDGSNPNILYKICNVATQVPDFVPDERTIDFRVVDALEELSEEELAYVIGIFTPIQKFKIPEHATVLLTEHFANLRLQSFEEQGYMYQMLADYFLSDTGLVVKPHPDDIMYYLALFPNATVIRQKFPAEFMPFIFDNRPETIATVSSTSVWSLRESFPQALELGSSYMADYRFTNRYFAALTIAQNITQNLAHLGINVTLAKYLCQRLSGNIPDLLGYDEENKGPYTLLIDNVTDQGEAGREMVIRLLQTLPDDSCVIFINSQDDYCWYSYEHNALWDNMVPVVLNKTVLEPQAEDFYASTEDETIFIYSKNKELLNMATHTKIEKELPHTGIRIDSQTLTPEQERIRMLEGILAATEKRLLYYIEKDKSKQD